MRSISELEFSEQFEPIMHRVFSQLNPYGQPFHGSVRHRRLLYPFTYALSEPWLQPITEGMRQLGEDAFLVSALNRPDPQNVSQFEYHWRVDIKEVNKYRELVYSQENAIYSINGFWGIICSGEDHALFGGSKAICGLIDHQVPDMEERLSKFVADWKYYHTDRGIELDWLYPMLAHVVGEEQAKVLLRSEGLEWLIRSD